MSERVPAIKVLLLPKDTNALGTIFGGVILAHIDPDVVLVAIGADGHPTPIAPS
jgi:acyl-CoA hydrolase